LARALAGPYSLPSDGGRNVAEWQLRPCSACTWQRLGRTRSPRRPSHESQLSPWRLGGPLRDATGRRGARRFPSQDVALAFDEALAEVSPTARRPDTNRHGRSGGVRSHRTAEGVRQQFVYRRSDGPRRQRAASSVPALRGTPRCRLIKEVERGEIRHTKETFGEYWERRLARRKPYPEPGTWAGYEIKVRKRPVPAFGSRSLGELSVDEIRDLVADLAKAWRRASWCPRPRSRQLAHVRPAPVGPSGHQHD